MKCFPECNHGKNHVFVCWRGTWTLPFSFSFFFCYIAISEIDVAVQRCGKWIVFNVLIKLPAWWTLKGQYTHITKYICMYKWMGGWIVWYRFSWGYLRFMASFPKYHILLMKNCYLWIKFSSNFRFNCAQNWYTFSGFQTNVIHGNTFKLHSNDLHRKKNFCHNFLIKKLLLFLFTVSNTFNVNRDIFDFNSFFLMNVFRTFVERLNWCWRKIFWN